MCQLTIVCDDEVVRLLARAGLKITLVRSTADQDPANVIWISCDPSPVNVVQWETSYGLYASMSTLTAGTVITKHAVVETAYPGQNYVFGPAFAFSGPQHDPTLQRDEYYITNGYTKGSSVVFGVTETVVVDGDTRKGNLINGQIALPQMVVIFKPLERITIYLSNPAVDGMVVDNVKAFTSTPAVDGMAVASMVVKAVQATPTTLTYGRNTQQIVVRYDLNLGRFVVQK